MAGQSHHTLILYAAGVGACVLVIAGRAEAYDKPWDNAKVLGAVAVRDRAHPEYEAEGLRIGNYLLFPEVGYGVSWSGGNIGGAGGDFRHQVTTGLELRSQLPRHFFGLVAGGRAVQYQDNQELHYVDGGVSTEWRIDIDHATNLFGKASIGLNHEESIDEERPKGAVKPPASMTQAAEVGLSRTFGRIDTTVGVRYRRVSYQDVLTTDGSLVDVSWQDHSVLAPYVQLGLRLSPGYRVFGRVTGLKLENRGDDIVDRDARGLETVAGVQFELTPLVRVALQGGWIVQNYLQPGLMDISAPTWDARVEWLISPLVTLTAQTSREVLTTAYGTASGRIATTFALKAEYEMWRNLILSARASISQSDYVGEAHKQMFWTAVVGANYALNKNWSAGASYEHQELIATSGGESGRRDRVNLNVKYRF